VRSRGEEAGVGSMSDLIEAGLNEAAATGSGYGDSVAAPIRNMRRRGRIAGCREMA
jgi:hypothetical protein